MNIRLLSVGEGRLTFTWDPVMPACNVIHYNINSVNCGTCPSSSNATTVSCIGNKMPNHTTRLCTFGVQAVICDSIGGNNSEEVNIVLRGIQRIICMPMVL